MWNFKLYQIILNNVNKLVSMTPQGPLVHMYEVGSTCGTPYNEVLGPWDWRRGAWRGTPCSPPLPPTSNRTKRAWSKLPPQRLQLRNVSLETWYTPILHYAEYAGFFQCYSFSTMAKRYMYIRFGKQFLKPFCWNLKDANRALIHQKIKLLGRLLLGNQIFNFIALLSTRNLDETSDLVNSLLFLKPVSWLELFLPFLTANRL